MNSEIRTQILEGRLQLPEISNYRKVFGDSLWTTAEHMFKSLWYHYLKKGDKASTSAVYWAKEFANPKAFNILLKVLSDAGWITVLAQSHRNWAELWLNEAKLLQFVQPQELEAVRKFSKFTQYQLDIYDPRFKAKESYNGLVRKGFALASKIPFRLNTNLIAKHRNLYLTETNKGINKTIEQHPHILHNVANYADIGEEILDNYIYNDATYMSGQNRLDPRGRDIAGYLNKIGNPIGYKVMRHSLVIPEQHRNLATKQGVINKKLYIAELNGFRNGSIQDKIAYGAHCYYSRQYSSNAVDNLALEQTYKDLNKAFDIANNRFKQFMIKLYNDSTRRASDKITLPTMVKIIETIKEGYKWHYPIEVD